MAAAVPARPGRGRRPAAAAVDALAALLLAMLLAGPAGPWFARRAVVTLRIGSPETLWAGPLPMALGMVSTLSYTLPCALLLVLLAESLFGVTPGKALLGLRVAGPDGAPAGRGRLWRRTAVKASGAWGMVLALALGSWPAALAAAVAGAAVLAGALRRSGRTLHDRAAGGTAVVPARASGAPPAP